MSRLLDADVLRLILVVALMWRAIVGVIPDLSEWSARRRYSHAVGLRRLYRALLAAFRGYLRTRDRVMEETA